MNPIYPSPGMYDLQVDQFQDTPDPFDEFLAQFLRDVSTTVSTPALTFTAVPVTAPTPVPAAAPGPLSEPLHNLTCHWLSQREPPRVCGAPLSPDIKQACAHFRHAHDIRGNDKATVSCHWYGCRAVPMQRGSVIRHVLSVHLGLLRWRCETCGRLFSRKGTIHACGDGMGA